MAVFSAIANTLFDNGGQGAAKDAANAQVAGSEAAIAEERRQFDSNRADLKPFVDAGTNALGKYQDAVAKPFDASGFTAAPDYQFRLGQGLNALQNSAAAKGMLHSGATLKGVNDYAAGSASQEYGNWYNRNYGQYNDNINRLAALSGIGQSATTTGIQAGTAGTNAIAGLQQDIGNAQAGGFMNAYQARLNNTNSLIGLVGAASGGARRFG